MKLKFLLLIMAIILLVSCTSSYKTGQTPDDVYYSPIRPIELYDEKDENRETRETRTSNLDECRLRMQMRNRVRWSALNDDYYYDNWMLNNSWRYGWNNPWTWGNSFCNCGYYYSFNPWYYAPYHGNYYFTPKVKTVNYKPPIRNFATVNNSNLYNPKFGNTNTNRSSNTRAYNNSNNSSRGGGFIRRVLSPSTYSSGSNSGSSNSTRTYSPSSSSGRSSSGSSSSSSSGGGGGSRPARSGGG